jgi:S-(hydroxymethyl)glutathione dehydrogenase/alcohol dehydrogenase
VRAAILAEDSAALQVEELRDPRPKRGEVLVKVSACGLCHTDLHVIKGEVKFPRPAVLGHEISGIVEDVGEGVTNVKVGDRVVCPFIMPCGECHYCVQGLDNLCEKFFTLNRLQGKLYDNDTRLFKQEGSPVWMYSMGGLAELAVVPSSAVFKAPDNIPLHESAVLGCAVFTAYGAVKNSANLKGSESVAVIAAGGVGMSIVYLSSLMGAYPVIAVDISEEKLAMAKELGATHTLNPSKEDVVKEISAITDGRGVDVAFEALGNPNTFATALNSVRDGGRVVVVGIAPVGVEGKLELIRIVRREVKIIGSYGARTRTDMPAILKLAGGGLIKPERLVTDKFALEEVNEGFSRLSRGQIKCRAVVKIG